MDLTQVSQQTTRNLNLLESANREMTAKPENVASTVQKWKP